MKKTLITLALVTLAGCAATAPGSAESDPRAGLLRTCQIAQIAEAGFGPVLAAKCAAAPDKLTDEYCLAGIGVRVAIQSCFAAAQSNDKAAVDAAFAEVSKVQAVVN